MKHEYCIMTINPVAKAGGQHQPVKYLTAPTAPTHRIVSRMRLPVREWNVLRKSCGQRRFGASGVPDLLIREFVELSAVLNGG